MPLLARPPQGQAPELSNGPSTTHTVPAQPDETAPRPRPGRFPWSKIRVGGGEGESSLPDGRLPVVTARGNLQKKPRQLGLSEPGRSRPTALATAQKPQERLATLDTRNDYPRAYCRSDHNGEHQDKASREAEKSYGGVAQRGDQHVTAQADEVRAQKHR